MYAIRSGLNARPYPKAGYWHLITILGPLSAPQLISSTDDMMSRSAKLAPSPRPRGGWHAAVRTAVSTQARHWHARHTSAGPSNQLLPGRCHQRIAIACDHRIQYGESKARREGGSKSKAFSCFLLFFFFVPVVQSRIVPRSNHGGPFASSMSQCRVDSNAWRSAWYPIDNPTRQPARSICLRVYNDPWLRQGSAPLPTSMSCRCQGVIGLQLLDFSKATCPLASASRRKLLHANLQ